MECSSNPTPVVADRYSAMYFKIVGAITSVETFARGSSIREIARLRKIYGKGRWRKRKGVARIQLADGAIRVAEIH